MKVLKATWQHPSKEDKTWGLIELVVKLNDGTIAKIMDNNIKTFSGKRVRKYDWRDMAVMNDAINTITGGQK